MQAVFEEIFEGKNINVKAEGNESSAKDRLHNFLLQGLGDFHNSQGW